MTATLQILVAFFGAILNGLLTYEAVADGKSWWKVIISAVTAVGLLGLAAQRAGLLSLQGI